MRLVSAGMPHSLVSSLLQKREIYQFQYTAWPDHGVPETTEEVLLFRFVLMMPFTWGACLRV